MSATLFENFTNLYPVSKTLRFELIPQGKTIEFIEKKGFLKQDEERAEKYKKVKKIIDAYHKDFIEKSLSGIRLQGLQSYMDLYLITDKNDSQKKELEKVKEQLRKQIANAFKSHEKFKTLLKGELIKEELMSFVSGEDREDVKEFQNFTTYFVGFHQNRANMYNAEAKATAIAYRLIHENIPKFIDNIKIFEKITKDAPELAANLNVVLEDMKEIISDRTLNDIFSLDYFNETLTQRGIDLYNAIIGGRTIGEGKIKIKGFNEYINTVYNQKQTDKKKKQPKFKQLYKQILSDRQSLSFLADAFQNDNEVLEKIEEFYSSELLNFPSEGQFVNVLNAIRDIVTNLESFDLSKIYIRNDASLTNISQRVFDDWPLINKALEKYYEKMFPVRPREKIEKYEERKKKWLKQDFGIGNVQAAINDYDNEIVREKNNGKVITDYFAGFYDDNGVDLLQKVNQSYENIKDLLNTDYPENEKLGGKEHVNRIKEFLDNIMAVMHFVRPLSLKDADKRDVISNG